MPQSNDCKHSDYKLCFKLKQHTPIIHFQADQKGATLRATELKPKLDRFLIDKLGLTEMKDNKKVPKHKYKSWFINDGKEHLALDYKMRIELTQNQYFLPLSGSLNTNTYKEREENAKEFLKDVIPEFEFLYPSLFFANMDKIKFDNNNIDEQKSKKDKILFALQSQEPISVTITSFEKELLEHIKQNIYLFFAITNFGNRQSKGFGSFIVEQINGEAVDTTEFGDYAFTTRKDNLFDSIKRFHQALRSGINEGVFYFKPFIFHYAKENNTVWDKRTFKEEFLDDSIYKKQKETNKASDDDPVAFTETNHDKLLVRDLLGLATEQNWRKPFDDKIPWKHEYGFTIRHPKDKNGKPKDQYPEKHQKTGLIPANEVKRMASPFIYKPILVQNDDGSKYYKVHIVLKKIPSAVFDKNFKILKEKNKQIKDAIDTKMWEDFSLKGFFEFVYDNRSNISNYSKVKGNSNQQNQEHRIQKHLEALFDSLKKSRGTNHD